MLCEACQKREALVHLTSQQRSVSEIEGKEVSSSEPVWENHHFCEDCADDYYRKSGMNSSRDLIQLSDRYRKKLYDRLEAEHPEVFRAGDDELRQVAEIMSEFLRKELKREGVELNEDGFGMLFGRFIGSAEFYERSRRHGGIKDGSQN
jgi:hypothetical protein